MTPFFLGWAKNLLLTKMYINSIEQTGFLFIFISCCINKYFELTWHSEYLTCCHPKFLTCCDALSLLGRQSRCIMCLHGKAVVTSIVSNLLYPLLYQQNLSLDTNFKLWNLLSKFEYQLTKGWIAQVRVYSIFMHFVSCKILKIFLAFSCILCLAKFVGFWRKTVGYSQKF